jgi:hypothetical protein
LPLPNNHLLIYFSYFGCLFQHIIIHEDLTNIKYPPLHDLNFEIIKSSARVKDILNGLLRSLHPESVSIVSSSDSKFAEVWQPFLFFGFSMHKMHASVLIF